MINWSHRWLIITFSLIIENPSMGSHWIIENPSMGNHWIIENPSMRNHWITENPWSKWSKKPRNPPKIAGKSPKNRQEKLRNRPKIVEKRRDFVQKKTENLTNKAKWKWFNERCDSSGFSAVDDNVSKFVSPAFKVDRQPSFCSLNLAELKPHQILDSTPVFLYILEAVIQRIVKLL